MNFIKNWARMLATFVLMALMVTIISATIFVGIQQSYRLTANDPQIELTQAISEAVKQGTPADAIVAQSGEIEIDKSLSLFVAMFDKDGKMIASSAKLGSESPTPPSGTFDLARQNGESRFTWQPKDGVRSAVVLKKIDDDNGFVLVGKSLKEVELREKSLLYIVGAGWIGMLILSLLISWLLTRATVQEDSKPIVEMPKSDLPKTLA